MKDIKLYIKILKAKSNIINKELKKFLIKCYNVFNASFEICNCCGNVATYLSQTGFIVNRTTKCHMCEALICNNCKRKNFDEDWDYENDCRIAPKLTLCISCHEGFNIDSIEDYVDTMEEIGLNSDDYKHLTRE